MAALALVIAPLVSALVEVPVAGSLNALTVAAASVWWSRWACGLRLHESLLLESERMAALTLVITPLVSALVEVPVTGSLNAVAIAAASVWWCRWACGLWLHESLLLESGRVAALALVIAPLVPPM